MRIEEEIWEPPMGRFVAVLVLIAACMVLVGSAEADPRGRPFEFVGMWQGIDLVDGDLSRHSIIPAGDAGFIIQVIADFRICESKIPGAHSFGTAVIEDGALVSRDRTIFCGDGEVVHAEAIYKPAEECDLLEVFVPAVSLEEPVVVLHRISTPPRKPRRCR